MSEFCRNCPMRGNALGNIKTAYSTPVAYEVKAVMGRGALLDRYVGKIASLVADNGGASKPFKVPDDNKAMLARASERLDECNEPYTEERGFWRPKLYVTGCPALGSFAVAPSVSVQLQNAFQQQANLETF